MLEIKGKFITLGGMLLADKPEVLKKVNVFLEEETGCTHLELDPEEFYDLEIWAKMMEFFAGAFDDPTQAFIDFGKRFYPTMKRTGRLGVDLSSSNPMDYFNEEIHNSSDFMRGNDEEMAMMKKKILKQGDNYATIYSFVMDDSYHLQIGIWLGLFDMIGVEGGKVEYLGDSQFHLSW